MIHNTAICIHGHFYQPPREDPLSNEIPLEPGAAPYKNWNEKIYDQCYRPNVALGNFKRISFNVGPTLLQWWERNYPNSLEKLVAEDDQCVKMHGVGNAMAQSYNHTILPLARYEDKMTQIRWGIADFKDRFGRQPQGMWLPETAVNLETLDVLSTCGIQFTILAPWQTREKDIDTNQPYIVGLPENKRIVIFFYDQVLSGKVSFEPKSTVDGDKFLKNEVKSRFNKPESGDLINPQLVMIATDGELYGHHQPFRDKFLAYITNKDTLEKYDLSLTYPALWLKHYAPDKIIEIKDDTSWSCHHGVRRWKGVCDCTPNAKWKSPLRKALNHIGDLLENEYIRFSEPVVHDVWEFRHRYYEVINGSRDLSELLTEFSGKTPNNQLRVTFDFLMRSQYERQRMFTSCGWFFDDFDRIEPVNNIAYASQAVWLMKKALGKDFSGDAVEVLNKVKSWRSGLKADTVFEHYYKKAEKTI